MVQQQDTIMKANYFFIFFKRGCQNAALLNIQKEFWHGGNYACFFRNEKSKRELGSGPIRLLFALQKGFYVSSGDTLTGPYSWNNHKKDTG